MKEMKNMMKRRGKMLKGKTHDRQIDKGRKESDPRETKKQ